MTRAELEALGRDALIAVASAAGVLRAQIMTRAELVDELVQRSVRDALTRDQTRGLFGRARDLLARLVELGLNRPDAAAIIRSVGRTPARSPPMPALPTLTLAQIYLAQGHGDRAVETLEKLLANEPDHGPARALLDKLRRGDVPAAAAVAPPASDEGDSSPPRGGASSVDLPVTGAAPAATGGLGAQRSGVSRRDEDDPLPKHYDVSECVALCVDTRTLYVYWEVRDAAVREIIGGVPDPLPVLRAVIVEPSWHGPVATIRDQKAEVPLGDSFLRGVAPGSIVHVAIGCMSGSAFVPIAHSQAVEMPHAGPQPLSGRRLLRWTAAGAVAAEQDSPAVRSLFAAIEPLFAASASLSRAVEPRRELERLPPVGSSENTGPRPT